MKNMVLFLFLLLVSFDAISNENTAYIQFKEIELSESSKSYKQVLSKILLGEGIRFKEVEVLIDAPSNIMVKDISLYSVRTIIEDDQWGQQTGYKAKIELYEKDQYIKTLKRGRIQKRKLAATIKRMSRALFNEVVKIEAKKKDKKKKQKEKLNNPPNNQNNPDPQQAAEEQASNKNNPSGFNGGENKPNEDVKSKKTASSNENKKDKKKRPKKNEDLFSKKDIDLEDLEEKPLFKNEGPTFKITNEFSYGLSYLNENQKNQNSLVKVDSNTNFTQVGVKVKSTLSEDGNFLNSYAAASIVVGNNDYDRSPIITIGTAYYFNLFTDRIFPFLGGGFESDSFNSVSAFGGTIKRWKVNDLYLSMGLLYDDEFFNYPFSIRAGYQRSFIGSSDYSIAGDGDASLTREILYFGMQVKAYKRIFLNFEMEKNSMSVDGKDLVTSKASQVLIGIVYR